MKLGTSTVIEKLCSVSAGSRRRLDRLPGTRWRPRKQEKQEAARNQQQSRPLAGVLGERINSQGSGSSKGMAGVLSPTQAFVSTEKPVATA